MLSAASRNNTACLSKPEESLTNGSRSIIYPDPAVPPVIRNRDRLYQFVVENSTDAIIVTDTEERIVYVNPIFLERTGYSFEEIKGRVPGHFLQGPGTDPGVVARMKKCVDERRTETFELVNYSKAGRPHHVRIVIHPIQDAEGKHSGYFSLQHDLTERETYRRNLELLNARLERQNSRLETVNRDLQEFAYVVSHDLKEPLRNISSLLGLLRESETARLGDEDREFLRMADLCSERLADMIDALLDYAKTGVPTEPLSQVDIAGVLESLKAEFSSRLHKCQASVQFVGQRTSVPGYQSCIRRLLENLVSNSLKYADVPEPVIEVRVEEDESCWKIITSDNGVGIPHERREEVFQLFNDRSREDGNGMGLAICKRIATLHRGNIRLVGNGCRGATFVTTISKNLESL